MGCAPSLLLRPLHPVYSECPQLAVIELVTALALVCQPDHPSDGAEQGRPCWIDKQGEDMGAFAIDYEALPSPTVPHVSAYT
ncbi:hypothetical protein [Streptomyces sp. NPDC058623]|uniref:hypothetical protein n=1 Tax=Streptomyces sp. NPDC058623 TaxID=3346563 RepID=UPI0036693353